MRILVRILRYALLLWLVLFAYNTLFPPVSTLMLSRWVTGQKVAREYVPLVRIAPSLARAAITAEDGKYCRHHGIDWKAMHGAINRATDPDGEPTNGASTITMQTAKNLFLWHGRSYVRKALEVPFALGIDLLWSKRRIMETYLNIAEFGPGIFGAEAAARHYFGVSAAALSPQQSALLVAILPNPKKRNARAPSAYVARYAASIGNRMDKGIETRCLR